LSRRGATTHRSLSREATLRRRKRNALRYINVPARFPCDMVGMVISATGPEMQPQRPGDRASNRMIAVIDDDAAVRSSLKFALEIDGFAVRDYAGANEFLNGSGHFNAGCLVVDYHLPDMDGLEMIDRLRRRKVTVPAILITSYANPMLRRRAAEAGVAIVEKPLLGNTLVDGINAALSQQAPRNGQRG
jgi:two-component system, LuxR family, response regulator FixJ